MRGNEQVVIAGYISQEDETAICFRCVAKHDDKRDGVNVHTSKWRSTTVDEQQAYAAIGVDDHCRECWHSLAEV